MKRVAFAVLIVLLLYSRAHAVVVGDTNIVFGTLPPVGSPGLGNYSGSTYKGVSGAGATTVFFDFTNGTLQIVNTTVDEGSDWYVVHAGDHFGPATIATNQFPAIPNSLSQPQPGYPIGNGDFYLGVATSDLFNTPFTRDIFGWVRIHDDNGVLSAVGNAVSYNSQGIVVGTLTEIPAPEPSAIILAGPALVCFCWKPFRLRRD